jgi:hypothetical protein
MMNLTAAINNSTDSMFYIVTSTVTPPLHGNTQNSYYSNTPVFNDSYINVTSVESVVKQTAPKIPQWCLNFDFFNAGIVMMVFCSLGLVGNIMAQYTLWPEVKVNSTSFLLICLGVFDSIVLVVHILGRGIPAFCLYFNTGKWYMSYLDPIASVAGWTTGHIAQAISAWLIVLISFCRYIAVCRPHDTFRFTSIERIRIAVVIVISCNLIYAIPRMAYKTLMLNADGSRMISVTQPFSETKLYIFYAIALYYILLYIIPFTLLVMMTALQLRMLRIVKKRRIKMTKSKRDERDINVTLIVVVIVFMTCQLWEPFRRITNVVESVAMDDCVSLTYHGTSLKAFFSVLNSAINFVIYFVFGKKFRRHFMQRVLKRNLVHPSMASEFPETTQHPVMFGEDEDRNGDNRY